MGLMSHTSGGKVKFGLASLAAAGALYCAVVIFDLGTSSPVALGSNNDRSSTVVRVPPRDLAVPGPVRRLPQVSPGPARRRLGNQLRGSSVRAGRTKPGHGTHANESARNLPASSPAKTRESQGAAQPSSAPPSVPPTVPVPPLQVPPVTLPPVSLPQLPLPPVTMPALQLPLVQLPAAPALCPEGLSAQSGGAVGLIA